VSVILAVPSRPVGPAIRSSSLWRAGYGLPIEFPHFVERLPFQAAVPHERRQQGLFVVCGAMFISAVDMTIVNVALPSISEELNAGVGELQWVLDAFLVALAGLLLVGSGLADRFGRKRVFLAGMTGFAVASVLCASSPSPLALIGARALMGAAASCVLPPALSLIAVMFPPEERPGALGVWAAVAGIGFALGPVLGGILVREIGWQAVFLVNVPVAVLVVPVGLRVLPESTRPGTPPIDLVGAMLSIASLGGIVFALIEGPDVGWSSPEVVVAGALGLLAGAVFVRGELRRSNPLFDVGVLARPAVIGGAVAILSIYIALMGTMFLLPQYLQYVHDRSVVAVGLLLAPFGIGAGIGAHYNARLSAALGARVTVTGGLVAMAASTALFLLLRATTSVVVVLIGTGLIGLLLSVALPPATTIIMDDLGEPKAGDGGAVNQLGRQVGGALGVAIVGTLFAGIYANQIEDKLPQLSVGQRGRATESIEEARDAIGRVAGPLHDQLARSVDHAFDVGARAGFALCVSVLLVAAVLAAVALAPKPVARTSEGDPVEEESPRL
jgi:MFS transporter, DHA2 family, multidrug resistance protein